MLKSFKRLAPCLAIFALNFASCSSMLLDTASVENADNELFEDSVAHANFSNTNRNIKSYSVTWKKDNGEVIRIDTNVPEGSTPRFDGDLTYFENGVEYKFNGWMPVVRPIYSDTIYTACFLEESPDFYLSKDYENDGYAVVGPKHTAESITLPQSFRGKPITKVQFTQSYSWEGVDKLYMSNTVKEVSRTSGKVDVKEIVFGSNVTKVDEFLFSGSNRIETVVVNGALKTIGDNMFKDCTNLKQVYLEEGIETVGEGAFFGCSSLETISFPSSLKNIERSAFFTSGITEVSLPIAMEKIGKNAFGYCSNLEAVYLPEYIQDFSGSSLFFGCQSLETVVLPKNITSVPQDIFYNCYNLDNVIIPEGVNVIRDGAFFECNKLKNISLPSTLEVIEANSFYNCGFNNLVLPKGLKTLDTRAINSCKSLLSVSLPKSLETIGEEAIVNAPDLFNVNYEGTKAQFNSIRINSNNYALKNTYKLYNTYDEKERINNGDFLVAYLDEKGELLEVQKHAASDTTFAYTGATPTKVTNDGNEYEFSGWNLVNKTNRSCRIYSPIFTKLPKKYKATFNYNNGKVVDLYFTENASIEFPADPVKDQSIFIGWDKDDLVMPSANITFNAQYISRTTPGEVYKDDKGRTKYRNWNQVISNGIVDVDGDTLRTVNDNYPVRNKGTGTLIFPNTVKSMQPFAFTKVRSYKEIVLQEGFTTFANSVFSGSTKIQKLNIPSTVTSIAESAFANLEVESIALPNGITAIERNLFQNCYSLTTVTFGSIQSIGYAAFKGCSSLKTFTVPSTVKTIYGEAFNGCTGLTTINIKEGVKTIEDSCFYGCTSLTTITLPKSLTTAGENIFVNCKNLKTINFRGTKAQFDAFNPYSKFALNADVTVNYNFAD